MTDHDIVSLLVNAVIGLGVFSVRTQIKAVKDLLTTRVDAHEKRLDKLEQ